MLTSAPHELLIVWGRVPLLGAPGAGSDETVTARIRHTGYGRSGRDNRSGDCIRRTNALRPRPAARVGRLTKRTRKPKTSVEKSVELAAGLEAISKLAPFIRLFGKTGREVADALSEARGLAAQARDLASLPGRFNAVLGSRGWIAFDRINADLLRRATELAGSGQFDEAEALLVESFDPESLRFQLTSMVAVKAARPREELLRLAAEDYEAGRYHASVPVVLAQIDGIVADVYGRTLFTKTKEIAPKLIAWDSISAQEGGLPDLVTLIASPRNKTTDGPIEVPYRHGILHGRDLGYANKLVAAKAWAALFSLREWAIKFERGETEPPPVEPAPSLRHSLSRLAGIERQRKAIEAWRSRPEFGPLADGAEPEPGTPEEAMTQWLVAWKERDFGAMSSWTQASMREFEPEMPGRLEGLYGFRELADFSIVKVRDVAAAMTEVTAMLSFKGGDSSVTMPANVVFEDPEGNPFVRGADDGRWGVNEVSALRQTPLDTGATAEGVGSDPTDEADGAR